MVKKKPVKPVKVFGRVRAVKEETPVVITPDAVPTSGLVGKSIVYDSDKTVIRQIDADILPPSLQAVLRAGTEARRRNKMPDNLEERTAAMVRRFKGDRPR